jgi:ribonucleotide reductase beta subunit family protein with ferritin-like domain
MPGLCLANDKIHNDGQMHLDFACLVFNQLVDRPPANVIKSLVLEAVTLEKEFFVGMLNLYFCGANLTGLLLDSCIQPEWIGMDTSTMLLYIEFVADCLLVKLGESKLHNHKNPVR